MDATAPREWKWQKVSFSKIKISSLDRRGIVGSSSPSETPSIRLYRTNRNVWVPKKHCLDNHMSEALEQRQETMSKSIHPSAQPLRYVLRTDNGLSGTTGKWIIFSRNTYSGMETRGGTRVQLSLLGAGTAAEDFPGSGSTWEEAVAKNNIQGIKPQAETTEE